MEKKLIALVFVALLAGLGGGYGLGYVIYQPQIQNLQDEVNTLSSEVANLNSTLEEMENKTWHLVTNFTLSPVEPNSSLFFIQGEKWRIWWEPQQGEGWYGFIIWDENGYAIEWVQVIGILSEHHDAKGIHYVPHGEGSYYIERLSGPNVNFTIESYH